LALHAAKDLPGLPVLTPDGIADLVLTLADGGEDSLDLGRRGAVALQLGTNGSGVLGRRAVSAGPESAEV
jgi:hypothetical protein